MFRHRHSIRYINHAPCTPLCRLDNVCRPLWAAAGQLYHNLSENYHIYGLSGRGKHDRSGGRLGVSSHSLFYDCCPNTVRYFSLGRCLKQEFNPRFSPTAYVRGTNLPIRDLHFSLTGIEPKTLFGFNTTEELLQTYPVKTTQDVKGVNHHCTLTGLHSLHIKSGTLIHLFLCITACGTNGFQTVGNSFHQGRIGATYSLGFIHAPKKGWCRYYYPHVYVCKYYFLSLSYANCKIYLNNDANFAQSQFGIADGHNKSKQLFIPNGKIGKFQVLGIDVASPCYVLPKRAGLQGRGTFLIPGIPIPSVRDVIASLAFFTGRRERRTINKSYLMFRRRLLTHYINPTPCIALCRQDNVRRSHGTLAGELYHILSENYIINGLLGREKHDRSGGRLGVSSHSSFSHTASPDADTFTLSLYGRTGSAENHTNCLQRGVPCRPSFFATHAGIGGVNHFSFRDGWTDRTRRFHLCERLGVPFFRPFFYSLIYSKKSVLSCRDLYSARKGFAVCAGNGTQLKIILGAAMTGGRGNRTSNAASGQRHFFETGADCAGVVIGFVS